MCKLFNKPHNNLIILTNNYYSNLNKEYIVEKNPKGIICTNHIAYDILKKELIKRKKNIPLVACPYPGFKDSVPLGLSYLLNYIINFAPNIKKMHIIGVTFYDQGPQYINGYKQTIMGNHSVEIDKKFTKNIIDKYENITIDYIF